MMDGCIYNSRLEGVWDGATHRMSTTRLCMRMSASLILHTPICHHLVLIQMSIYMQITLLCSQSLVPIFFGRNGRCALRINEEKDHPDCYQQQVQQARFCGGTLLDQGKAHFHFCDGSINTEKYTEISEQHCFQDHVFFKDIHAFIRKIKLKPLKPCCRNLKPEM